MSLDDLQAQLRGTLDQQFAALKQKYEDAIADARRQAAADAEREVAAKLERAQAESDARLRTVAADLRAAAERDVAVKVERARGEFEQARAAREAQMLAAAAEEEQRAAEAAVREREEQEQKLQQAVDQALAAARRTAELELDSERRRAHNELEAERQKAKADLDAAKAQADAASAAADAATSEAGAARTKADAAKTEADAAKAEVDAAKAQADAAKAEADTAKADADTAKAEADAAKAEANAKQSEVDAAKMAAAAAKAAAEAERQRAQAELDGLRQRMQTEIAAAKQASAAGAKAAASAAPASGVSGPAFERSIAALREIDGATTLSQALQSLLTHAAATSGRAALFLINGDRLKAWKTAGIPDIDVQTVESSIGGKDLLARAIQAGQATPSSAMVPAPPFARLPVDRASLAIPLMIGGRAVAVLYTDSGVSPRPPGSAETVEALVRHASAIVALRTAMRTLDVLGGGDGNGDVSGAGGGDVTDEPGARRYAKLLVSEIKMYNEAGVRAGRQQRDLLRRLRAEIDRAKQLYEERVPPAVTGRYGFFHQELVQTLADGDETLLGNP